MAQRPWPVILLPGGILPARPAYDVAPDFTLDVFRDRHHFKPPHRFEMARPTGVERADAINIRIPIDGARDTRVA